MNRLFSYGLLLSSVLYTGTAMAYKHADTLRGSNGRGRAWWDVKSYNLQVKFDTAAQSIEGSNQIFFQVSHTPTDSMQIDLQRPMVLDSAYIIPNVFGSRRLKTTIVNDGNVWWLKHNFSSLIKDSLASVVLYYHGTPRKAVNPPWDGGFSWREDSAGNMVIAVSCQGLGASVWWPCKDAQWDEPDQGMHIDLNVPAGMSAISNGRLIADKTEDARRQVTWEVLNPINNYDVTFYIGDYVHWSDTVMGEKGKLDLNFYVLRNNEERARKQFQVVKQMIHCFEYWMGPYPFYEDGYKLVEAPYLGMEHQSAVAYGNGYRMGYKGMDRSMSGYGLKWDYIIIHESGHEWFGNSITAADMADNWIHEGITSYSEVLFTECLLGKEKAWKYGRGLWSNIRNTDPVIGPYGVNDGGMGDIYEKGAAVIQMIRVLTNDDTKFRNTLRGLSSRFYHSIVTSAQVEQYITEATGLKLAPFFDQYLRHTDIPILEYNISDNEISYRFSNVVPGFSLPVTISAGDKSEKLIVTDSWQKRKWDGGYNVKFSKDFLIKIKK